MIFELEQDFHEVVAAMPQEHPKHRILELLEEAIRRDIHFIARRPTTLFQCMWNRCWWYDQPAQKHCGEFGDNQDEPSHREKPGDRLRALVEHWHDSRECVSGGVPWLRSLLPPPLMERLDSPLHAVFPGHDDVVESVCGSSDGRFVASASRDGTVRVWDVQSGQELGLLRGHEGGVMCVEFSPDDTWIATGGRDGTIRLWDWINCTLIKLLRGHSGRVNSVAFSPDGNRIITGGGHCVRLWEWISHDEPVWVLEWNDGEVRGVAFSPEGRSILVASDNGVVRQLDEASGLETGFFKADGFVVSLVVSPDGKTIAAGGRETSGRRGIVWLWERDEIIAEKYDSFLHGTTGYTKRRLSDHEDTVWSVRFSEDGQYFLSGSEDTTIRLYRASDLKALGCVCGHYYSVGSVVFLQGHDLFVSGSGDWTVRIWKLSGVLDTSPDDEIIFRGKCLGSLNEGMYGGVTPGFAGVVNCVAFSPDGKLLAAGAADGTVRLWEIDHQPDPQHHTVATVRGYLYAHPDGVVGFQYSNPHVEGVSALAFSLEGQILVTGGRNQIRFWSLAKSRCVGSLRPGLDFVLCLAISHDGDRLAAGGGLARSVSIFDLETHEQIMILEGHDGHICGVSFSPDGSRVVTCSQDKTVRVWEMEGAKEMAVFMGHRSDVLSVTYSPDGRRIVSRSWDEVRIWDADNGNCLEVIQGSGDVSGIAEAPMMHSWRALRRDLETVIEDVTEPNAVTWFADDLSSLVTHRAGRCWAGATGKRVHIIELKHSRNR